MRDLADHFGGQIQDAEVARVAALWKRLPDVRPIVEESLRKFDAPSGITAHLDKIPLLERLQGNWRIVFDSQYPNPTDSPSGSGMKVAGKRLEAGHRSGALTGIMKFDDSSPDALEIRFTQGPLKGKTVKAIQSLKGGVWTLVYSMPGKDRPKSLNPEASADVRVWRLHRVEP
jgi:uncharacterized protein (TIGR03067 family)